MSSRDFHARRDVRDARDATANATASTIPRIVAPLRARGASASSEHARSMARLTSTRSAGAELLDEALRHEASTRDAALFHAYVESLSVLYERARREGTWTETFHAARCLKAVHHDFPVRVEDVERAFEIAEAFSRGCMNINDDCATEWCGALLSIVERFEDDMGAVSCAWEPMFECVESFFPGNASAYYGFGSISAARVKYLKVVRKCRRFFREGSAREIWARIADKCRATEHNACFEALGLAQLFMPCMKMAEIGDDATFFAQIMRDEWAKLSHELGTCNFWVTGWISMFSQLAKHDVRREIEWVGVYSDVFTTILRLMELPIGGVEGRTSYGRKMNYRAAMAFSSQFEPQRRVRAGAKFLIYRAMHDVDVVEAIENIVDFIEHFYHPSSSGSFTGNLSQFLRYIIKYTNKFLGDETRAAPPEALARLIPAFKRLTDKAMYSKSSDLRRYATVGVGRLAYMDPSQILPSVMTRFEEALGHETATRQLVPAINCLSICVRPMLMLPPNTVYEDKQEAYLNVSEFLASALNASLPGIDINDASKTCATLRFFCMVIMNVPRLIDAGEPGAISHVPIAWSDWTVQFLTRLFILFEHLQPDTHGSKSDAADAFKGATREASGFLLSSSSMYTPLLRLLFERLDPTVRGVAVVRVATFIRENTLPEVCEEIAILAEAAMLGDAELAYVEILCPVMATLDEDLHVEGELSTTTESRIYWGTGILTRCASSSREVALRLVDDFKRIVAKIYNLSEKYHNLDLATFAEMMISALIQGLMKHDVVDAWKEQVSGDDVTTWLNLKWSVDENGDVIGNQCLPAPFEWSLPSAHAIEITRQLMQEFLINPAHALLEVQTEDAMDCDDITTSIRNRTRTHVSMMSAVLSGLEEKLQDFSASGSSFLLTGHAAPFQDATSRALAARALVGAIQRTSADDTDTLNLICTVAESAINPPHKSVSYSKRTISSLNANAFYFTQPQQDGTRTRYPRWFVAEKVRVSSTWRDAFAAYFSGSPLPFNAVGPSEPSRSALLSALQDLALTKYASVRAGALPVIQGLSERFPLDAMSLVTNSINLLAKTEEDEDSCIAACEALQNHFTLNEVMREGDAFVSLVEALLGSAHHGTEKAQNSIGSLFLHLALLFTRSVFHPLPRASVLQLKQSMLEKLRVRAGLHWSYEMMTNALSVFFVDPKDNVAFLSLATERFIASVLGDLKVVRFPAMCALLMMSRYDCFESSCAPQIKLSMNANAPQSYKQLLKHFAIAHTSLESSEPRGRPNGKSDALMQAAESLYGFANEMSGSDWPSSRAGEILTSSGAFIVAVARFWMLLTSISPADVARALREAITESGADVDRSTRCAISEALAGALASRLLTDEDRMWMEETFLKFALDAPPEQREEWLKGAAYCTDSGENCSDTLLRQLSMMQLSTVAQMGRSLEITRICVAQLSGDQSMDIKLALFELLADPMRSPLANENRLVRESAAQLAATLLADRNPALDAAHAKLIDLFTIDIENVTMRALASDPAEPDTIFTPSRNALEGVFYTYLELCRRGDIPAVASSAPLIVRAALRTTESKDKDFALVAKLTVAYLKYPRFEVAELHAFTAILQVTLQDENWHTRAAALRYIQALIYHHAFSIPSTLFVALRESVVECLQDKQLEVTQLASQTLMIFFKGVGFEDAADLRKQFLDVVTKRLPQDAANDIIMRKYAAVLGLSACVLSHPYDVPSWMPEVMEALSFAALEPSIIKQATQKTFAEFKKTHQDTWSQTRAAFTHEQWENITIGLELAPSYII